MIVVPAIDMRGGKVVRLKQGRLREEKVYGADPAEAARHWAAEGGPALHVVDLDAAIEGGPSPTPSRDVIEAVKIPVEVGGGLRVLENAMRYLEHGADRVIFGTAAVARPGVVQAALACGRRRWRWPSTPRTARWRWRAGTRSPRWPPSTSRRG